MSSNATEELSLARTTQRKIPVSLETFIQNETIVACSPGRINLIGEHTDYNNGFVLPAAIDKAAYIALTPRADEEIHLHSIDLNDHFITDIHSVARQTSKSWPNYILGVVEQFRKKGFALKGFDAALTADVPIGAGLSSSAAVECATAFALNTFFQAGFDKQTLVKMAQKAEHEFAGVQCGIMDQFASVFGKHNHVIRLDCRSLEYVYEPLQMDGYKVVLLDTNVHHSLASSEYNVRRMQCEKGLSFIQQDHPEVKSLRDVNVEMLDKYVKPNDDLIYNRCRYVVDENARLLAACNDLENNDIVAFGKKMFETHDGLSKLYEVSCKELDFLVDYVRDNPAVVGARMMGGGFGGCTINLVKEDRIDALVEDVAKAYKQHMNKDLKVYIAKIEDGSQVLKG
ncbi:galactokinase [Danxiaibacter flavus]|uniref:Galactokinase n=1 Tax=Danxiaibacter flavus TaxID=3049108 RepID=A0ABV3ZDB8_9BACT|nr:galactokinase [Chitinophagaceae bacterium DXS]